MIYFLSDKNIQNSGGFDMKKVFLIGVTLLVLISLVISLPGNKVQANVTVPSGTFIVPDTGIISTYFQKGTHNGIDYQKRPRTGDVSVKASAAGTVSKSYYSSSYGYVTFIKHNINGQIWETVYAHLTGLSLSVGQSVSQGQHVGYMGDTGTSTGDHLHFELHLGTWNDNKTNAVNPLDYFPGGSKTTTTPTSGWVNKDGKWYYYETNGELKIGWHQNYKGEWFYLKSPTGEMATKWHQVNSEWYYFDAESGVMKTGWIQEYDATGNLQWYYLDNKGKMVKGWYEDLNTGDWYYLHVEKGHMLSGWQYIGSNWYYFYTSGKMAKSTSIDGYNLGPDGKRL